MTVAAAQWWVRLGAAKYGPMPWEAVRQKRDAGLFSRWHEVSLDGTQWLPIDDANVEQGVVTSDDAAESSEAAVDWASLASVGGPASALDDVPKKQQTAFALHDLRFVATVSCCVLWLALGFVPIAWDRGSGVRFWSWPGGWSGIGVALAQAYWLLLCVGVSLWIAVARRDQPLGSSLWRLLAVSVLPGTVLVLLAGLPAARGVSVLVTIIWLLFFGLLISPWATSARRFLRSRYAWWLAGVMGVTVIVVAWWACTGKSFLGLIEVRNRRVAALVTYIDQG